MSDQNKTTNQQNVLSPQKFIYLKHSVLKMRDESWKIPPTPTIFRCVFCTQ